MNKTIQIQRNKKRKKETKHYLCDRLHMTMWTITGPTSNTKTGDNFDIEAAVNEIAKTIPVYSVKLP